MGLGKIDLAIINREKSGLGLGVRGSFAPQILGQKGKEKVGLEGQVSPMRTCITRRRARHC